MTDHIHIIRFHAWAADQARAAFGLPLDPAFPVVEMHMFNGDCVLVTTCTADAEPLHKDGYENSHITRENIGL